MENKDLKNENSDMMLKTFSKEADNITLKSLKSEKRILKGILKVSLFVAILSFSLVIPKLVTFIPQVKTKLTEKQIEKIDNIATAGTIGLSASFGGLSASGPMLYCTTQELKEAEEKFEEKSK